MYIYIYIYITRFRSFPLTRTCFIGCWEAGKTQLTRWFCDPVMLLVMIWLVVVRVVDAWRMWTCFSGCWDIRKKHLTTCFGVPGLSLIMVWQVVVNVVNVVVRVVSDVCFKCLWRCWQSIRTQTHVMRLLCIANCRSRVYTHKVRLGFLISYRLRV
jgi:hypothetical protein